ncbi:MAG: DEAD/DEAH box helicase, partial [Desulfobacterales bacterium]
GLEDYIRSLERSGLFAGRLIHVDRAAGLPDAWAQDGFSVSPSVAAALKAQGILRLFAHQAEAVEMIRAGRHVVVATPTASGKSMIYTLPILERLVENPGASTLYLSPLKALAQDQLRKLVDTAAAAPGLTFRAAIYDGDTPAAERKKIRALPPNVLMTTPEMLHLSFLAHHGKWEPFFSRLSMVVVDEVHTYRGVMGSHMAQVFRRLLRICKRYGSRPVFVLSSATVANPGELARQLTSLPVAAVEQSDTGRGERTTVMIDSSEGAARDAILLLKAALHRGLRTIVYTQSRKMAELISVWVQENAGRLAGKIAAYRAGFLPEERRQIEQRLAEGSLLAVVSTSALESGIDIGDLDLCILVGYPGSIMATRQRAGRVGRGGQPSAVILLAGEDALDQYLLRHPETVLKHPPEPAVVNPENPHILGRHLVCAAAEMPLDRDETWLRQNAVIHAVEELARTGELLYSSDGRTLYARERRPHRKVDLRGAGRRYAIVSRPDKKPLGDIDGSRAFRETHPGAIYLHGGETYRIETLDIEARRVIAAADPVDVYTRSLSEKEIDILETVRERHFGRIRIFAGRMRVTDRVTGYETWQIRTRQRVGRFPLDLPPVVFETEGLWFSPDRAAQAAVSAGGGDLVGALHAAEHAMIGIFPLVVLADRDDLGGLATPFHPALGGAAVFIYDGVAGGAGLCRAAFDRFERLFLHTLQGISACPCKSGCPACIQSSHCGSGNRPLDKDGAVRLLKSLLDSRPAAPREARPSDPKGEILRPARKRRAEPQRQSESFAVLDVETRRSAAEVGGWQRADRMGVSCAVLYDSEEDRYFEYFEEQLPEMFERLETVDRVVGFNIKRFDYRVLTPYTDLDLWGIATVDLLEVVHRSLGFRLSLDHLAAATLGQKKTADGLQALVWWQEGNLDALVTYCRKDVEITRDLYRFGREKGYLLFDDRQGQRLRVPVDW